MTLETLAFLICCLFAVVTLIIFNMYIKHTEKKFKKWLRFRTNEVIAELNNNTIDIINAINSYYKKENEEWQEKE